MKWLQLSEKDRIFMLRQVATQYGLPEIAVEKDWWVTTTLRAVFSLQFAEHLIFKGGTSLSKVWKLIERFSEDIDLAIDRELFDLTGELTVKQIKELRKRSSLFVQNEFHTALLARFKELGLEDKCSVIAEDNGDGDKTYPEPRRIFIKYKSVFAESDYLEQQIVLEIGARSLVEPTENNMICSLIREYYPSESGDHDFFNVSSAVPQKTFLEKAFLLHELFSGPQGKMMAERKSRHLYDLERLMDTIHGIEALKNHELFQTIKRHREIFTHMKGVDYSQGIAQRMKLIPPDEVLGEWEKDYKSMQKYMIYGDSLSFDALLERIKILQDRFVNSPLDRPVG